jgi:hypothetical protein
LYLSKSEGTGGTHLRCGRTWTLAELTESGEVSGCQYKPRTPSSDASYGDAILNVGSSEDEQGSKGFVL